MNAEPGLSPEPARLLREVWGFDDFRPGQAEIVAAVAAGRDVLAIMPTGGGKSLCFQLPALMRDGLTVVVSPLIALMRDQVRALTAAGVAAGALTSAHTDEEQAETREALNGGRLRLLYVAPERLAASGLAGSLRRWGTSAIAVDEAHCVSQWGHDFRPDYLRIGDLRAALDVPLSAFTATADAETRDEIARRLFGGRLFGGRAPQVFLRGFDRPNIHLAFAVKDRPREQVLDYARKRRGQAGIVYCGTRAKTEGLARALNDAGIPALAYHAGLEPDARREAEARFQREDGLVVAATVAFGMGIDKPDIRWVAHADLPKSVESYYQEIGRAGRDGLPAEAMTFYGPDDIRLRRSQIDEGAAPEDRKLADHGRLNALIGIADGAGCRRQALLRYFGEESAPCGACDACDAPIATFDATTPARMALSAALRTDERFGAGHLIDVLTGAETEKVRSWGHHSLPTFGVGRDWSKADWQAMIRQMMGQDLLRPDPSRHGALRVTDAAVPVLKGEASVTMRRETPGATTRRDAPKALVRDEDEGLFAALKALRLRLAQEQNAPAYVVFTDRTLIEMAERRPATLDALAGISGVGARKLEAYGRQFLEVLRGEAAPEVHPARRKLAGRDDGALYDRLAEAAQGLARGEDGHGKLMSLTPAALRRIAERRPRDRDALARVAGMDGAKLDRFADALLGVVAEAD